MERDDGATAAAAAAALPPPLLGAAAFPLPGGVRIRVSVSRTAEGHVPLVWSSFDCVRLRGEGGVAISPVGMCELKVATNAKAAAVPAVLADEEFFLCHSLGWLECRDAISGLPVDAAAVLDATLARAHSESQRARVVLKRVAFADLWARGYRLTSGLKFGVDYLAYRSDPSVCHAAFMVRVLPAGMHVTPLDLVARARVATTTLKTAVLAYVDVASRSVHYEAFKRMGPGQAVFAAASAMQVPLRLPPPPPPPAAPAASEEAAAATAGLSEEAEEPEAGRGGAAPGAAAVDASSAAAAAAPPAASPPAALLGDPLPSGAEQGADAASGDRVDGEPQPKRARVDDATGPAAAAEEGAMA